MNDTMKITISSFFEFAKFHSLNLQSPFETSIQVPQAIYVYVYAYNESVRIDLGFVSQF